MLTQQKQYPRRRCFRAGMGTRFLDDSRLVSSDLIVRRLVPELTVPETKCACVTMHGRSREGAT